MRIFKLSPMKKKQLKATVGCLAMVCSLTTLIYTSSSTWPIVGPENRAEILDLSSAYGTMDNQGCSPQNHIMFLKIHKCASSTVQSIFLRYGYKSNLTFALPDGGNYLGNPSFFQTKSMPRSLIPPSGFVDIFAMHTRLNEAQHRKVLYKDTSWITVVREPITLYESLFNYFRMHNFYNFKFGEIATRPIEELKSLPRYLGKYGKNQMLFDLGQPDNITFPALKEVIGKFDSLFDLVLISEHMDESLILLRHVLCWSLHDVVVFTRNARREELKPKMSRETMNILKELNSQDVIIYNHFLSEFKRKVVDFGIEKMANEIEQLRSLREHYYQECGAKEVKGKDEALIFKEYSGLVNGYALSNTSDINCVTRFMPELPFIDMIRKRQRIWLKKGENT